MKQAFFTGIVVILPMMLTFYILYFIINFLTAPFLPLFESDKIFLPQIPILVLMFFTIVLVGFLGETFLTNSFFSAFNKLMHKIPYANKIYKATQEVTDTLFNGKRPNLSSPVQIPFPKKDSKALGFITNQTISLLNKEFSAVYVPGAPTPVFGLLLLMPKDQLTPLHSPPDEAVKFLVSCGTVTLSK